MVIYTQWRGAELTEAGVYNYDTQKGKVVEGRHLIEAIRDGRVEYAGLDPKYSPHVGKT